MSACGVFRSHRPSCCLVPVGFGNREAVDPQRSINEVGHLDAPSISTNYRSVGRLYWVSAYS